MKKPWIAELFYTTASRLGNAFNEASKIAFGNSSVLVWLLAILVMLLGWLIDVAEVRSLTLALFALYLGERFVTGNLKVIIRVSRKSRKHPPSLKRISNFADFWGPWP